MSAKENLPKSWPHHIDSRSPSPTIDEDNIPLRELQLNLRRRATISHPPPPTTTPASLHAASNRENVSSTEDDENVPLAILRARIRRAARKDALSSADPLPAERLQHRSGPYAASDPSAMPCRAPKLFTTEQLYVHQPRPAGRHFVNAPSSSLPPPDFWSPTSPTGRGYIVEASQAQCVQDYRATLGEYHQQQQQRLLQVTGQIQYPEPVHHAQHVQHPHHPQPVLTPPTEINPYMYLTDFHINVMPDTVNDSGNLAQDEPGWCERVWTWAKTNPGRIAVNVGGPLLSMGILGGVVYGVLRWKEQQEKKGGIFW